MIKPIEKVICKENNFIDSPLVLKEVQVFSLEEFLEKFPYKIGDKAFAFGNKCTIIDAVWDESIKEMVYTIKLDTSKYTTTKLSHQLQPYKEESVFDTNAQCCDIMNHLIKEETMEGVYAYNEINCYHQDFGDKVRIRLGNDFEIKIEDNATYIVKKQPEYPKTYEECCKVLGYSGNYNMILTTDVDNKLFNALYRLKVCRDAYWNISGEQMGLGKPWKPDYTNEGEKKFSIWVDFGKIKLGGPFTTTQMVLSFPTKEMRDAFYENFKDLIEKCKELL